MYLVVVILPLLSSILAGFFGRFLGSKGAGIITTSSVGAAAAISIVCATEVGFSGSSCFIKLGPWLDIGLLDIEWGFLFDSVTVMMLTTVTIVSTLVHLYSTSYMADDPHQPRFMSYLSLFTFFMLILITGDNFIQMFLGWEGVGLCSYLLINFWYTRIQANKSAIKAMLINRIGDFGLALGIFGIFIIFKTVDLSTVFALVPSFLETANSTYENVFDSLGVSHSTQITVICLLLFVGAVGKSAQLGLHTWLPDAMEGPTPVSALIHAATMVTAGVYLIIRTSPIFEFSSVALSVVTVFGAMTAFFAATTAIVQNDLKKVIAYSTCSQLGYMVFACGLSNYNVSLFHLVNHAYFKALLFLSAGAIIHALADEQDMRRMGGLSKLLPYSYIMILIGSLSLMGFPFLTGFYSKDLVLEVAYAHFSIHGTFAHWLGTVSAFFTSFYSMRLIYFTFLSNTNSNKTDLLHVHEAPLPMAIPLFVLAIGSIFFGYITRDFSVGLGSSFWGNSIFILPEHMILIESEFIPYSIKLIPVIFSISGATLSFCLYQYCPHLLYTIQTTSFGYTLYTFLNKKWFIDRLYNEYLASNVLRFGYKTTFKILDKGLIELCGPSGLAKLVQYFTQKISKIQTGYMYHYAFFMLIGITSYICLVFIMPELSLFVDLSTWWIYVSSFVLYIVF